MTVESFPRGGKKTITRAPSNFLFDKKEKKIKKSNSKKKENEIVHVEEPTVPNVAQCLTYSSLTEGMIVLGRVRSSTEYELIISLPGRLKGYLSIADISQSYTNLLQNLVEGENHPPEFKPLNELYKHEDYLVCYVKSINPDAKHQITLSIEPELINQNLDPEKLQKGSKIACTISSIEDHGYVVDTGMKILRGFLSKNDIDNDIQYYPGQQIFCAIKSVKSVENVTTIKLSTKLKHTTSVVECDNQSLDAINPGTLMTLDIKSILSNGLQVTFNKNNIGYINQIYLNKPLSSYEEGESIVGKLLYVMPTVKLSYFTESLADKKTTKQIKIGEIIEKAKFLYRESNGIILHLMKGVRGFISFKRTNVDFDAIQSKFIPNSVHKCRVIAYDIFDQIYICSMERQMLKEKFIAVDNVKAGDKMSVQITRINNDNGFMFVKSNNIVGDVPPEHIIDIDSESKEKPKIGEKIMARVLGKNKQGNGLLFTLKKSLVDSDLPILSDINDAKIGSKFNGTITQITPRGLLIVFYNNIKGWIPPMNITKKTGGSLNYTVGQVILVKIDKIDKENNKLLLSIVNDMAKLNDEIKFKIGEAVEGTVVESSIDGAYLKINYDNNDSVIGFLPAGHISPCTEIATYLSARYVPGDKLSALVFSTSPEFLLTRTYVTQENNTDLNQLQIGSVIPCSIKEINNKTGLKVVLPIEGFENYGNVPLNKLDNIDIMYVHQILYGRITNINKKEKKINLTTILMDVWNDAVKNDADMLGSVDQLTLYLSKLKELSSQPYYKSKPISGINLGKRVSGIVDKVTEHGLVLKLDNNITGTVRPAHYKGTFKIGDKVKGTVLWINIIHELVEVTLLPMLANSISDKQAKLPQNSLQTQLRGEVVLITDWFVLIVLKGQGKGTLVALPSRRHVNDLEPKLTSYTIGKKIRCYVVLNKNESELLPICLVKSAFELKKKISSEETKNIKRKIDIPDNDNDLLIKKLRKNAKIVKTKEVQGNKKIEEPTKVVEVNKNTNRKRKIKEEGELNIDEDESEVNVDVESEKVKEITANLGISECGFYWDAKPDAESVAKEESSSDSDEDEKDNSQQAQKKKKKLNAAERREMERQKEREIRAREEELVSNQIPNSVDQFDRLVLASPDSSIVWLQYMAYHLQATEIDRARAVAKRAIKTINYREENEKLNVWRAWLNLESRFGTPETLNDIFHQAINANDAKNIYLHMLSVHADAGRHAELEKMIKTVTGKFKQLPEMWIEVGTILLKVGLKDKSRHIMQRALQSLPPQEHVNLMVRFAQLENKFGDKERAQTLFEKILSSYPKRLDVWTTYIDALIKCGDIDGARQILNKAVVQTLPPRKMRTLFKKFIAFEEQHGTPEGVEHARELAVAYVEKQCSNETN
ncbi:hypothetical protein PV325_003328 [Microctonus aethiopoides]|nr:hypothetical protein PV325_003328 [Microctonus aethiopoides]